jgi:spore germination protein YaaH
MLKKLIIIPTGIFIGIILGYIINISNPSFFSQQKVVSLLENKKIQTKKQIIGFLPYWLLDKANTDYSNYITTLTYFGLTVDTDGTILKLANEQEMQPGWNALQTGKLDPFFQQAKANHVNPSLLIDSGDVKAINSLVEDPIPHARNLIADVEPLFQKYGFSDLNLDIEYTQEASGTARLNFTKFVQEIKKSLGPETTLTVEISTVDVIRNQLIDVQAVGKIADYIVLMAYDFHSPDSYVTGPIAPLSGAGIISEYDVSAAIEKTKQVIAPEKIILGIPLYGYEWETIGNVPRSAVISGTGVTASNQRAEQILDSCVSCSAKFDTVAQESYLIYKDQDTETYHQIFYPDKKSVISKIKLTDQEQLGGIALWALGYEGKTILDPLLNDKR